MKMTICLNPGGKKSLPDLASHSASIVAWNILGEVALEKLVLLKSSFSLLNLVAYMRTDDVLAVPEPPINKAAFWQVLDFGCLRTKFNNFSTMVESLVGNKIYENWNPLSGGLNSSGVINANCMLSVR